MVGGSVNTSAGTNTGTDVPPWVKMMLDHHVTQLRECSRYDRVWWYASGGTRDAYLTIRVTAATGTLTLDDRAAMERLQRAAAARHPELTCTGRMWSTEHDEMAVTWRYVER
jgi:hypothetical protein